MNSNEETVYLDVEDVLGKGVDVNIDTNLADVELRYEPS